METRATLAAQESPITDVVTILVDAPTASVSARRPCFGSVADEVREAIEAILSDGTGRPEHTVDRWRPSPGK
jgi:hypothetical protein